MNHIKWLSLVALVIAALSLVSCASKQAKDSTDEGESFESPVPPADQQAFERGMSHLEREEYELALEEFDRIIESNPSSEFHLVTLFNRGAALEGMGKCSESTKAYRQTLRLANKRYRRIEAQALFRLAYTYECLGDIPKQIASLRDAMRRRKFLSQEISAAELPARLAAAYARTGNLKTAEKYFAEAQKGLMLVHTEAGDPLQRKELLARTLFFMGRVQPDADRISRLSDAYIGSLKFLQAYLLKSTEMESKEWSPRAAENLVEAYRVIWLALEKPPQLNSDPKDKAVNESALRQWRANLARGAINSIQSLRTLRFPDPKESLGVQGVFNEMDRQERKLQAYLADLAVSTDLTPEAKTREGIRRDGRVKATESSPLERKAVKRYKLPQKKKNKKGEQR
ncbi:MAG: hypothetical protein KDD43_04300 [Bdellovibrionales bacterium]|nr:hypothetical protein [Bdellovibrionales bacterium]